MKKNTTKQATKPASAKKASKSEATKTKTTKTAAKPTDKKDNSKPTTKKATNNKTVTTATKQTTANKSSISKSTTTNGLITVDLKFHPDSNGGHHHIIVEDLGDNHVSVGLTTSPKYDSKHKNIKLEHSPISNHKQSYASRKGTVDKKKNYNSPKQGQITQTDKTKVKQIADKAKAKVIKKGDKK